MYDIIGDVHGQAGRVEALLARLGYAERAAAWRHPERTAIFVGDLIDRGPGQLRTLELVRAMTGAGSARVVMGNHELNAIGWATVDPADDERRLRPRHGPKGAKREPVAWRFVAEAGRSSPDYREYALQAARRVLVSAPPEAVKVERGGSHLEGTTLSRSGHERERYSR